LVTNQSIVSLAWEPQTGLVFGGSGNVGGGGARPTEKEAMFFAFDPQARKVRWQAALVPGAQKYPATVAAAGGVFTTAADKLLRLDPRDFTLKQTIALPGGQVDISLAAHRGGRLVGLTRKGVYVFDLVRNEIVHTAAAPVPVNCGFALVDDAVYFGAGTELWRYRLPDSFTSPRTD
jgi:outer membrane protein assembly factor BamB